MRFAPSVAVVCLSLALSLRMAASADAPLDRLLLKIRAAAGTPYAYHVRTIFSDDADPGSVRRTLDVEGLRRFVHHCAGDACNGRYDDGQHSFQTNLNGTALPIQAPSAFDLTLQAVIVDDFADAGFRAAGGSVALREPVARGGKNFFRITVSAPRGAPFDVLVDSQSYLVAGTDDGRTEIDFRYAEPREGTLVLPSDLEWRGARGRTVHFERWSIVETPLAPPAGLAPHFENGAATLKMLASRASDVPLVPCTLGGQTVACLLDTGNSGLSMSLELAEALGIEPSGGGFEIRGIGQYATGVAEGPALKLGSVTFPAARYVVLHDIHQYGYDVVLGADVFARTSVTLDYGRREVGFAPSGGTADPGTPNLRFENFVPVLDVTLGTIPAALALDSGDESTINLGQDFYERNPSVFAPTRSVGVAGVGGTSVEVLGQIPAVHVANFTILNQRIGATKKLHATADGHLGSGFLAHFSVRLDYANGRVELVPRPGDASVTQRENYGPAGLQPSGRAGAATPNPS